MTKVQIDLNDATINTKSIENAKNIESQKAKL